MATEQNTDRWTPELSRWLVDAARDAGFALAGVAPIRDPAAHSGPQRFEAWIDSGFAGEMDYLKRRDESGAFLRSSVRVAFPWARSVIVCGFNYAAAEPRSIDPAPPATGWIALYARSGRSLDDGTTIPTDYHDDLLARLRRIEAGLLSKADCSTRCYVDTGPVVERSLAAEAGVGWIGKNTCVINQELGSWLLLGVIITSLPAESHDPNAIDFETGRIPAIPAADRCGTCTRCIDACPTSALLGSRAPSAPREMDASRCIAYLTIEKKGDIPENLRASIGRNVFGCDICQEVCPWNAKAAVTAGGYSAAPPVSDGEMSKPTAQHRPELVNPSLEWLAEMDSREFRRRFQGSPVERTGRKRLLRNVAVAMGNSGEERFLAKLDEWASSEGGGDNDRVLRDSAEWASKQIRRRMESSGDR